MNIESSALSRVPNGTLARCCFDVPLGGGSASGSGSASSFLSLTKPLIEAHSYAGEMQMGNETKWWVSVDGQPTGPHTEAEIKQKLAVGELRPTTYACRVGTEEWKRLGDCEEFHEPASANNDSQTPPPPPDAASATSKPAWNPLTIAWLGLLFTPIWTGVMAAVNARRLGLDQPLWRPLAIGLGTIGVEVLWVMGGFDLGVLIHELVFTVAPLFAIYHLDLAPQEKPHAARQPASRDHWIAPVLAGSPLALLTIVGWGMTLFGPLEPIEVVKRFDATKTAAEAREFVTSNLYQMVDDMEELEKLDPSLVADDGGDAEYLDEYYDEKDNTQYFVEYRMYAPAHGGDPSVTMEGYYHLRWLDRQWKIDDIAVTSFNGRHPDGGSVSFSMIVSEMLKEARRQPPSTQPKASSGIAGWYAKLPTATKRWLGLIAIIAVIGVARAIFNIKIQE